MANPPLLDYIKQQLAANVHKDIIKSNLVAGGGWSVQDIDDAFSSLAIPQSPEIQKAPKEKSIKSTLLVLVIFIILGGAAWAYMYRDSSKYSEGKVSEINLPSTISSSEEITAEENKTSTLEYNQTILSFSYPSDWHIYRNSSNDASRVYLVKDPTDLEGSFFDEIQSKQKTHIEIGLYSDAYTAETIKRFYNPIEIEAEKKLRSAFGQTLIWFLGKDIENWGPAKDDLISSYVILLPFDYQPKTLIVSLRPYSNKGTSDIYTVEKIMSSFQVVETKSPTNDIPPIPNLPNRN